MLLWFSFSNHYAVPLEQLLASALFLTASDINTLFFLNFCNAASGTQGLVHGHIVTLSTPLPLSCIPNPENSILI